MTRIARMATLVAALAAPAAAQDVTNVMVFGDSITWGWVPKDPITPTERHAEADRWPQVMQEALGEGYHVVTEGLSGRTTNVEDETAPGLMNGAEYLDSALMSHAPLDIVVIMLGTNDTKTYLGRSPLEIGLGMGELVDIVQRGSGLGWYTYEDDPPEVLVVSPPPLGDEIDPGAAEIFEGSQEKIEALPAIYDAIAKAAGAAFFDAAPVVGKEDVGPDGIHLLVQGNRDLGEAVAGEIAGMAE